MDEAGYRAAQGSETTRRIDRWSIDVIAVIPAGLIPGDDTRTTLGAWDLPDLMDQLDAIYPNSSQDT